MTSYHFATLRGDGTKSETLPPMELKNDDDASDFGRGIVRDLIHGDPAQYSDWILAVTEGDRVVRSIPFASVSRAKIAG